MNNKDILPSCPNEHKIMLLLGMRGIKRSRLDFRTNSEDERYFSFDHWLPVCAEDINYVQEHCDVRIDEISWYDDDCGWQCYYTIDS
jgi:hypothetical protein